MSKKQTYGFKLSLFKLDLSFIGWAILSLLTLNLVDIWLSPYITLTNINYYFTALNLNPVAPSGGELPENDGQQ